MSTQKHVGNKQKSAKNGSRLQSKLFPAIFGPILRKMSNSKPVVEIDLSGKLDRTVELNDPPLEELLPILRHGIRENFAETTVEIVECPDFTQPPFNLAGHGIGTELRVAEVGGQGNLFPSIRKEKVFDLKKVAETCELPECFVFGPGAGPRNEVGVNCEMIANAVFDQSSSKVNSRICKIQKDTYKQEELTESCFGLMANLGICKNEKNVPVLKITAKCRTGQLNFPEAIRQSLSEHYGGKLVSFCGIFLVGKGKVLVHVMPDFPDEDFYSRDELQNEWLQYFEVSAPLVCTSVFHSTDPDLDLRLEHTHLFSEHGDAGHFHYDTTPETVEYTGYFRPATKLYRIDQVDIHGRETDLV